MPPLTLTNATPADEALAVDEARPTRGELRAELLILAGLVAAVVALYVLAPDARSADPLMVALCVTLIALAHAARFDLPLGWTAPVQLALVPTIFLLPPWLVPVAMAVGIVASRVPDVLRGRTAPGRLLVSPGNAWFTVGPVAVYALSGMPGPAQAGVVLLVARCSPPRSARTSRSPCCGNGSRRVRRRPSNSARRTRSIWSTSRSRRSASLPPSRSANPRGTSS